MTEGKIQFSVDRTTGIPPYLQIVEQVKEALHIGKVAVGDYLPSVSEVARVTAINANTVMKAYRELEYAGIAQALQGVGTVIVGLPQGTNPELFEAYRQRFEDLVTQARQDGLAWESLSHLTNTAIRSIKAKEAASGCNIS
ncbi:MAG: GntR family transcriptional regulator [Acidimicrobiaceae bacterium]|nr:GntR family transcriptional regulator [Acidimicrobiaceae bacterium]